MTITLRFLMAGVGCIVCGVGCGFGAQITNYETEGNLESNYDIGCVDSGGLSNKYSPADLYRGLAKCINEGNYERGVLLFALAGVYGTYDTFRVADESAHQATIVLRKTYLDSAEQSRKMELFDHLKHTLGVPDGLKRVCSEVRKIGAPAYFPRYMIQHGMKAALREMGVESGDVSKNGLTADFEPQSAWEKSLDSYLHCPKE